MRRWSRFVVAIHDRLSFPLPQLTIKLSLALGFALHMFISSKMEMEKMRAYRWTGQRPKPGITQVTFSSRFECSHYEARHFALWGIGTSLLRVVTQRFSPTNGLVGEKRCVTTQITAAKETRLRLSHPPLLPDFIP